MITYEEALDILENKISIDVRYTENFERDFQCLLLCKEALKKQMVQKLDFYDLWELGTAEGRCCPSCGYRFGIHIDRPNYCPQCGQKIDWEE